MKNRQRIRYGILMLIFLAFPITLNYYSPYLSIMGPSQGIINGSLIVFAGLFLTSMFFGRFWCGWLCPAGAVQEGCSVVQPKRFTNKRLRFLKYFLYAGWLFMVVMMFIAAGGIMGVDFFFMTDNYISVSQPFNYIIYYGVLFITILLPLIFGKRASCYMICWMAPFMIAGQTVSKLIKLPRLRIFADEKKCVDCKKCEIVCPKSLPVTQYVKEGEIVDIECNKCFSCADVCKNNVLSVGFRAK